ncbi:MAG TPA: hypothetical protein VMT75_01050 [Candidatus Saccharimonadales bacterium]|nr:hypothetical protein [Candidatus Saccharimonadales bacterium]
MLFAISIVALAQFALYYWRAVLSGVASQPVSSTVFEAVHVPETDLRGSDFEKLAGLLALTPELEGAQGGLGSVGVYYKFIGKIDDLFGKLSPALAAWSEQEQVLCARYAAVLVERRLMANLEQAASLRSC